MDELKDRQVRSLGDWPLEILMPHKKGGTSWNGPLETTEPRYDIKRRSEGLNTRAPHSTEEREAKVVGQISHKWELTSLSMTGLQ